MTEAIWGEAAKTPEIDWRMSASLENVPRGETDVPKSQTSSAPYATGSRWILSTKSMQL
jgi:hypothetical protein